MAIMDANPESHQYQYIQDTSLASLDSKTSPLAMLVRTCSQIGADPPVAAAAKSKKQQSAAASGPAAAAADRPHSASPAAAVATAYPSHAAVKHHRNHNNNYVEEPPKPAAKLNFKPYENTVLTLSPHHQHNQHHHNNNNNNNSNSNNNNNNNNNGSHRRSNDDDARPKSSGSEDNNNGHGDGKKRKSASPRDDYATAHHRGTSKSSRRSSSSSTSASSETAAAATAAAAAAAAADPSADNNPIIRSGLEVMHGAAAKAFCPPPMPMAAHSPYKPDALAAFRHTYLPGAPWMPMAAARPPPSSPGECKDPLCGGPAAGCGQQQQQQQHQQHQQHQQQQHAAAFAFASQYHPMMAGGCPAGCAQCDHQRYLTSLMAAATVPAFYAPVARPYTCSWVIPVGGGGNGHHRSSSSSAGAEAAAVPSLCGKSFGTSDELLQHIRTHTSGGATAAAMHAAGAGPMSPTTAAALSAYNGHLSRHLFHHPSAVAAAAAAAAAAYGKLPAMMSPYSAFNPTAAAYCYLPPPPPQPQPQPTQTSAAAAAAAATAAAAYHHHHHPLYSPRGDTSAATVSR